MRPGDFIMLGYRMSTAGHPGTTPAMVRECYEDFQKAATPRHPALFAALRTTFEVEKVSAVGQRSRKG